MERVIEDESADVLLDTHVLLWVSPTRRGSARMRVSGCNWPATSIVSAAQFDAGASDWDHMDPFDRIIVAQVVRNGLTVATADKVILDSDRCAVVDARR